MSKRVVLLILFISILTSIASTIALRHFLPEEYILVEQDNSPSRVQVSEPVSGVTPQIHYPREPDAFVQAAQSAVEAVTFIRAVQLLKSNFWGGNEFGYSTGSGVLVSPDGYILSNMHVIENATEIKVTLNDKREYTAKLIGTDKSTDLALLKIEENGLPFLEFGNSDSLQVGEWVLAVGNPFKLQSTVTAGIVSAKGRNIDMNGNRTSIESFIQTDAAVNSGNSGGAMVNAQGKLMGINTAIMSYSGKYEGYSFAVPSNIVLKIFEDLKNYGQAQRGWMDISISNVNQTKAQKAGLDNISGVFVDAVFQNGAAHTAGLKAGDIIYRIDDYEIKSVPEFMERLAVKRPREVVRVSLIREGNPSHLEVILTDKKKAAPEENRLFSEPLFSSLGFEIRNLTAVESAENDISGVKIIDIKKNSQAEWANMEIGYIITHVDTVDIKSVEHFITVVSEMKGSIILQGIYEEESGDWLYELDKGL